MKSLPALTPKTPLRGKKILIRVDWNIPLSTNPSEGDLLKIERSAATIKKLQKQGAIVVVLTHLGRPKAKEKSLSTARLLPFAEAYLECPVMFLGEDIENAEGKIATAQSINTGKNGSVFLMENVRFYKGEDKNDKKLANIYASLADVYINDAFASCHRKHASVAALASLLPHFAGPSLIDEVAAAAKIIQKPKKPFVAVIGGAKLSTKMPVITSLAKKADKVLIGGAMAHSFFKAKKLSIGKSYIEEGSDKIAKKLIKNKKIVLPQDVLVAKAIKRGVNPKQVNVKDVKKTEMIGDIGPVTMQEWSAIIKSAQTILWNGPLGVFEITAFSHGSLVMGYAIASRSKGKAYGIVGGGDTIPVALATGMDEWFDHISTGGGALLEFIAKSGKLPGLEALQSRQKTIAPAKKSASAKKSSSKKKSAPAKKSAKSKTVKKSAKAKKK
ncbi:MAG: phosphoglycerate kinase [Patescibacteria group bacterium]